MFLPVRRRGAKARRAKAVWVLAAGLSLPLVTAACSTNRVRSQGLASPTPSEAPSVTPSGSSSPSPTVTTPAASVAPPVVSPSPAVPRLVCSSGTPPMGPGSMVATAGDITARISWVQQGDPGTAFMVGANVQMTRAGTVLLQRAVTAPDPTGQLSDQWARGWEGLGTVCVEVPTSGLPLVHLTGYAGAMTCCGMARTYYPRSDGTYATVDRDLGRGAGTFELLSGQVALVASNADFNTRFDCGACSPGALQILTFTGGRIADITRQFPSRIAAEADGWWKVIEGSPPSLGLVAPWTADECELGKQAPAYATLDALNAAGKLVNPSPTSGWPEGSAFISALKSFLKSEGYCS